MECIGQAENPTINFFYYKVKNNIGLWVSCLPIVYCSHYSDPLKGTEFFFLEEIKPGSGLLTTYENDDGLRRIGKENKARAIH